jgi:hypothetical protein
MAGAIAQDRQSCQFPFLVDEKPAFVPGGLGGAAVGGARGFLWRRSGQAEESVKDEAARYRQRNENIALVSLSS